MLLFILWRDTTSELWTLVQFLYIDITVLHLLVLFIFLQTITFYHLIRLILCSQQTVRLITSLLVGTKYLVVLCAGSTLLLVKSYMPTSFLAPLSGVSQS
jgi:hypothetical protein